MRIYGVIYDPAGRRCTCCCRASSSCPHLPSPPSWPRWGRLFSCQAHHLCQRLLLVSPPVKKKLTKKTWKPGYKQIATVLDAAPPNTTAVPEGRCSVQQMIQQIARRGKRMRCRQTQPQPHDWFSRSESGGVLKRLMNKCGRAGALMQREREVGGLEAGEEDL